MEKDHKIVKVVSLSVSVAALAGAIFFFGPSFGNSKTTVNAQTATPAVAGTQTTKESTVSTTVPAKSTSVAPTTTVTTPVPTASRTTKTS
ncbi:MAG: hypothetical protein WCL23_02375 [Candidatus Moraniibacteriota bacterium]